jgi:rod shape-determining protein MreC
MGNLLEFFIRYKYWLVFLLLEAIGFVVLFRFNNYQGSVYLTSANAVTGTYYSAVSGVTSYLDLKGINSQLSADNVRLRQRVVYLEECLRGVSADSARSMLDREEYALVDAQVVNATLHRNKNLLTINKGEADGVRQEMGVVCSAGVVGIVALTSEHYSIVIPLINVDSHVSCRLKESEHFGTMQWKHGDASVSYVTDVPRHANIEKGEVVETNGFSDIFPAGLPVGKVLDFEPSADGLDYLLRVSLNVDFSTLRDVSVLTNYVNTERKQLEEEAMSLSKEN